MTKIATFHDLNGASVFITGGGSGIGASITDAFMGQGSRVAFVQRSDASEFADQMQFKHGSKPLHIACDVTDITALREAMDHVKQTHGPITVLVNMAANDVRHTVAEVTEEFWDHNQAINLKSHFFACQAVVEGMRAAGSGSIINFSSIAYMLGSAGFISYSTANSGLNGMTRSLARELGPDNIRVNALAPGWTMTQKQKDMWVTPDAIAAHLESQCLSDALEPEDIVGTVLFLASSVSKMMTGQTLVVDGGVVVTG
jgi:NAD(P)-dependent dehydrogenase (short-subunit alcohol dehydrogenase family)